ncbi:ASCH domain-containing protein [Treponema sp. Marseille-Q3903]|uniref:ASCH domain-containing protein n=1 Tax=Treponema sp. Marseille-Q3903 TaxID=2766703 RepID=UPI00165276CC|nr:ASCH domain-containing protein [Treponema sp. Marseille-Q3903]MBC6714344.1 ASCH domain-containing protein [Treponema sp. Marseille-Q3903]
MTDVTNNNNRIDQYWNKFIKDTGRKESDRCSGDLIFEAKGFVSDELIALVISGKKNAFFTTWATYTIDGEPLPLSGELYVVLDRANNPRCIIETESVEIVPFNQVTWEMAKLEGEDQNLEEWRQKKIEYLEDEGAILGFEFTEDIKLVFQRFKVVYR